MRCTISGRTVTVSGGLAGDSRTTSCVSVTVCTSVSNASLGLELDRYCLSGHGSRLLGDAYGVDLRGQCDRLLLVVRAEVVGDAATISSDHRHEHTRNREGCSRGDKDLLHISHRDPGSCSLVGFVLLGLALLNEVLRSPRTASSRMTATSLHAAAFLPAPTRCPALGCRSCSLLGSGVMQPLRFRQ
jgi:hypothetical protein